MPETAQMDLFGGTVEPAVREQGKPVRKRSAASNDMHRVQEVLAAASGERGYVLAGVGERVYRLTDSPSDHGVREIGPVPAADADMVGQLIESGWLRVGGAHTYRWRNHHEGAGYAVLVPKRARDALARWTALREPASWGNKQGSRKG